jgi:hypothetical protein
MGKGIFYYAWGKKSYSKKVIYQGEEINKNYIKRESKKTGKSEKIKSLITAL